MWSLIEGKDYSSFEWAAKIFATLRGAYICFYSGEQKRKNKVGASDIPLGLQMMNEAVEDQAESELAEECNPILLVALHV